MIVEHEILEQIFDDDWTLSQAVAFMRDLGGDAWQIILWHAQEENIRLLDTAGNALPDWRVREIIRDRDMSSETMVHCTEKGAKVVT